jgi:acyl-CoA dehydrogenase
MSDHEADTGFSLDLSSDLREMRDWVHEFAETVIRPAGSEWDEREETPWPVLQQASKIGLYSLDFFAQQWLEPSGLGIPIAWEELFWGDAGIALSIVGTGLAAVAVSGNGTHEQMAEWLPPMFGDADDVKLGAFCVSEPDAGSDVAAIRTRAVYQQASDEWVLNGTKSWVTNGGIANVHVVVASVDPGLGSRGQATFVVPPATPGLERAPVWRTFSNEATQRCAVLSGSMDIGIRLALAGGASCRRE